MEFLDYSFLQQDLSLCPVECLKTYLQRTCSFIGGQLFKGETTGSKLSNCQLRSKLTTFIRRADPNSMPKGHDPRKVASSLNFFSHMSFDNLKSYTGWKSSKVFFRHYLKKLTEVKHFVVAAGNVCKPAD